MSYTSRYDKGDWKADCDVCGRTYKASQLQKRWDGLMCCRHDWEIRQPQDFVRGVADTQIAPWTRPEPTDQYLPITVSQLVITSSTSVSTANELYKPGPGSQKAVSYSTASVSIAIYRASANSGKVLDGSAINTNSLG